MSCTLPKGRHTRIVLHLLTVQYMCGAPNRVLHLFPLFCKLHRVDTADLSSQELCPLLRSAVVSDGGGRRLNTVRLGAVERGSLYCELDAAFPAPPNRSPVCALD